MRWIARKRERGICLESAERQTEKDIIIRRTRRIDEERTRHIEYGEKEKLGDVREKELQNKYKQNAQNN